MSMKLLSKQQIKVKRQNEDEQNALRAAKINKYVDDKIKELNAIKAKSKEMTDKMQADLKKYAEEVGEQRGNLQGEIKKLEDKRERLLEPLDAIEKRLDRRTKQLEKKATEQEKVSKDQTERTKTITKARKELTAKQTKFEKTVEDNKEVIAGLEALKRGTDAAQVELAKQVGIFGKGYNKKNKILNKKQEDIKLREKQIDVKVENVKKREEQVVNDKRAIKDGYESLARAREEILGRKK